MPTNVFVNELFENLAQTPVNPELKSLVIGPLSQIKKDAPLGTYDFTSAVPITYSIGGLYAGATLNEHWYSPIVGSPENAVTLWPNLTAAESDNLTYIMNNDGDFSGFTETTTSPASPGSHLTVALFHAKPVPGSLTLEQTFVTTVASGSWSTSGSNKVYSATQTFVGQYTNVSNVIIASAGSSATLGIDQYSWDATSSSASMVLTIPTSAYGAPVSVIFTGTKLVPRTNGTDYTVDYDNATLVVKVDPTPSLSVHSGFKITYDFFPLIGPVLTRYDREDPTTPVAVSPRYYTIKGDTLYVQAGLGQYIDTIGADSWDTVASGSNDTYTLFANSHSFLPLIANGDLLTGNILSVTTSGGTKTYAIVGPSTSQVGGIVVTSTTGQPESSFLSASIKFPDYSSRLSYTGSAIRSDKSGVIYEIASDSDMSQLHFSGTDSDFYIEPANPLAYGAQLAVVNGGNHNILVIPVSADTLEGYQQALDLAGFDRTVYEIAALSSSNDIMNAVATHVQFYSDDTNTGDDKKRACMFSPVVSDGEPITNAMDSSSVRLAKAPVPDADNPLYLHVYGTASDGTPLANFVSDGVSIGDRVKVLTGANAGDYKVFSIVKSGATSTELVVFDDSGLAKTFTSKLDVNSSNESSYIIYKDYTVSKAAFRDAIAGINQWGTTSENYRVKVLWPCIWSDFIAYENGVERLVSVPGYFACAAYAGLFSNIQPHQGLSRYNIGGLGKPLHTNNYFSYKDLNVIEDAGIWIMVQKGDAIYCREQYTAAGGAGGAGLAGQRSIVAVADTISKRIHDALYVYTGVYNITPQNIPVFRQAVESVLQNAKEQNFDRIGSLIIGGRVEYLGVSKSQARTLNVQVKIVAGEPVDVFLVTLVVSRYTGV